MLLWQECRAHAAEEAAAAETRLPAKWWVVQQHVERPLLTRLPGASGGGCKSHATIFGLYVRGPQSARYGRA